MDSLIEKAYAQTKLDICPQGQFEQVCGASIETGNIIGTVITVIFIIAIILALVFLIYGGLRWIISGGDKGKVEEARSTIIAAIIGLVLIFLSYFILNFVLSLFGISLANLKFPKILLTDTPRTEIIVVTPTPTPTPIIIIATPTPTPLPVIIEGIDPYK